MITVHGRTRQMFYKGRADWAAIAAVKQAVGIPVIANGDIVCPDTARQALEMSGADGVMIGRGAQGAPWRVAAIAAALHGTPAPCIPVGTDLADLVAEHHGSILSFYGRDLGLRIARKHLGWYADEAGLGAEARRALVTAGDEAAVLSLVLSHFSEVNSGTAARAAA
jgi:tRNA-dihydrouridine synthase